MKNDVIAEQGSVSRNSVSVFVAGSKWLLSTLLIYFIGGIGFGLAYHYGLDGRIMMGILRTLVTVMGMWACRVLASADGSEGPVLCRVYFRKAAGALAAMAVLRVICTLILTRFQVKNYHTLTNFKAIGEIVSGILLVAVIFCICMGFKTAVGQNNKGFARSAGAGCIILPAGMVSLMASFTLYELAGAEIEAIVMTCFGILCTVYAIILLCIMIRICKKESDRTRKASKTAYVAATAVIGILLVSFAAVIGVKIILIRNMSNRVARFYDENTYNADSYKLSCGLMAGDDSDIPVFTRYDEIMNSTGRFSLKIRPDLAEDTGYDAIRNFDRSSITRCRVFDEGVLSDKYGYSIDARVALLEDNVRVLVLVPSYAYEKSLARIEDGRITLPVGFYDGRYEDRENYSTAFYLYEELPEYDKIAAKYGAVTSGGVLCYKGTEDGIAYDTVARNERIFIVISDLLILLAAFGTEAALWTLAVNYENCGNKADEERMYKDDKLYYAGLRKTRGLRAGCVVMLLPLLFVIFCEYLICKDTLDIRVYNSDGYTLYVGRSYLREYYIKTLRLTSGRSSYGGRERAVYDENGNLIYNVHRDGSRVTWVRYEYDENNNLIYSEDSYGSWERTEYSQDRRTKYSEDSSGLKKRYEYDENGKLKLYKKSDGYWEQLQYDENGKLIYTLDSDRNVTKMKYNEAGKRVYYLASTGFWCRIWYEEDGTEVEEHSTGYMSRTTFDEKGRPVYFESDGETIRYDYNGDKKTEYREYENGRSSVHRFSRSGESYYYKDSKGERKISLTIRLK